jgi:hypothetical protein
MKKIIILILITSLSFASNAQNNNPKLICDMINKMCPLAINDELELSSMHCHNLPGSEYKLSADYVEITYRYTKYESGDEVKDLLRAKYAEKNSEDVLNGPGGEGFNPLKDENYIFILLYIDKNRKEITSVALKKYKNNQYKLNDEELKNWKTRKLIKKYSK